MLFKCLSLSPTSFHFNNTLNSALVSTGDKLYALTYCYNIFFFSFSIKQHFIIWFQTSQRKERMPRWKLGIVFNSLPAWIKKAERLNWQFWMMAANFKRKLTSFHWIAAFFHSFLGWKDFVLMPKNKSSQDSNFLSP